MAEKKKSTKAKTTKSKKPKTSKAAPPAAEPEREPEKPLFHAIGENQQWSVLLFAVAILILAFALVQGTAGWFAIHKALRGFFGVPLLAVPVMLVYLALKMDKDETAQTLLYRALTGLVAIAFLSGFIEIMFGGGRLAGEGLGASMKLLYEKGKTWDGGGLLSAVIAIPLLDLFGDVGAKIIICLLLFVSLMWLTKKSLSDFFSMIAAPFRTLGRVLKEGRDDDALLRDYELEEMEEELRSEEEALSIAEAGTKKRPKKAEPQFLMDIPLAQTEEPVVPKEKPAKLKKPDPVPEPTEDTALDDLIRRATEVPKKKTKAVEKEEGILEIAEEVAQQAEQEEPLQEYQFPTIDFLKKGESFADDPNAAAELREKADKMTAVLQNFNVTVRITNIARGPSVTRYEVQPAAGVKVSKITGLADDIALNMAAPGIRMEAPIPGKAAIGIEVPNSKRDEVSLREILESREFTESSSKLSFAIGKDIGGNVIIGDIAKMPHMIIAGTTGSGKSVCNNAIIMSILYHATPSEVKLILIDPKIVEFRVYDGIPHLLIPVVTDPKKAAGALNWAVQEMLERYQKFADNSVRDLKEYNQLCHERPDMKPMPQIVIIIDELADLMMASSKEVEDAICRLAQMARAAGMHLIIATQRPTTDIITGLIKANIPSRIALMVKASIDSRIILDTAGAEKLLGKGDLLYMPNGQPKPTRVQGCYVSTQEIERVVSFIKSQCQSDYDEEIMQAVDQIAASSEEKSSASDSAGAGEGDDDLIERAIEVVVSMGQASTSNLQRRLKLGYARAARIMDQLEEMGVIGPYEGAKPRRVLMSKMQYEERKLRKMS